MKRYSLLALLTLGISSSAMAAQAIQSTPNAASFFVGGCGLILLTMGRLAWKTRRIGK
jgi:hypothetical protein